MAAIVISYARVDQPLVRQLVDVLRHALKPFAERLMFWDAEFEPDQAWFEQFSAAVDRSPELFRVVVRSLSRFGAGPTRV